MNKDGISIWYNILSTAVINKKEKTPTINDMFGVHVFPTKILIDKTGKIIGRYTGTGDDIALEQKLATLFN